MGTNDAIPDLVQEYIKKKKLERQYHEKIIKKNKAIEFKNYLANYSNIDQKYKLFTN